jgi:hypothetical protein
MSDDLDDIHLPLIQRIGRWIESRMVGIEFICHECNGLSRHGRVAPDGSGCFGQCGLTAAQRAAEYRRGSDAYVPRVKGSIRDNLGIGATD